MILRDQITVGTVLRHLGPRWKQGKGTIARVIQLGTLRSDQKWYFHVEWLSASNRPQPYVVRLFEEDLSNFDLHTEPIDPGPPATPKKPRDRFKPARQQESLPLPDGKYD